MSLRIGKGRERAEDGRRGLSAGLGGVGRIGGVEGDLGERAQGMASGECGHRVRPGGLDALDGVEGGADGRALQPGVEIGEAQVVQIAQIEWGHGVIEQVAQKGGGILDGRGGRVVVHGGSVRRRRSESTGRCPIA